MKKALSWLVYIVIGSSLVAGLLTGSAMGILYVMAWLWG